MHKMTNLGVLGTLGMEKMLGTLREKDREAWGEGALLTSKWDPCNNGREDLYILSFNG